MVWKEAWQIEERDWNIRSNYFNSTKMYKALYNTPMYSVWWMVSDKYPSLIRQCENRIKLICGASKLKVDDFNYKNRSVLCEY